MQTTLPSHSRTRDAPFTAPRALPATRLVTTLRAVARQGWTSVHAPDHDDHMEVARKATEALRAVHGTVYEYGPSGETIYPTSGTTDDWAYGAANIKYAIGLEARDKGRYGFVAPAAEIRPAAAADTARPPCLRCSTRG